MENIAEVMNLSRACIRSRSINATYISMCVTHLRESSLSTFLWRIISRRNTLIRVRILPLNIVETIPLHADESLFDVAIFFASTLGFRVNQVAIL